MSIFLRSSAIVCFATLCIAQSAAAQAAASDPFATTAKVSIEDDNGPIALKRPEQIAFMFISAISTLEDECRHHASHACSMEELLNGAKSNDDWTIGKLKFDPNKTDPNYAYKITAAGTKWEAWANPKKPGLGGFYASGSRMMPDKYYNAAGPAAAGTSRKLTSTLVDGDSFKGH